CACGSRPRATRASWRSARSASGRRRCSRGCATRWPGNLPSPEARVLLAIDTSTALASVALYDGRVLAEATSIAGQDHSRQLLPRIEDLLGAVQRSKSDLTALGVALGPGSFNGLRVGIATAKALAFARGLPIVGIETLRVTAYPFRRAGRPIRPLYD